MFPLSPARIVACDDHAHITCTLDMTLRKAGFEVETYPSGELALEAIRREIPSLISSPIRRSTAGTQDS